MQPLFLHSRNPGFHAGLCFPLPALTLDPHKYLLTKESSDVKNLTWYNLVPSTVRGLVRSLLGFVPGMMQPTRDFENFADALAMFDLVGGGGWAYGRLTVGGAEWMCRLSTLGREGSAESLKSEL